MSEIDKVVEAQEERSGGWGWFFAGLAIGASVALLYAPNSGKDTRKLITRKTQEAGDAVTSSSRDMVDRGKDIYDRGRQVVEDAADLFERGRRLVRGA